MIIGIENTLNSIKQYLDTTGKFEIYILGTYYGPIDAFIYQSEGNNEMFAVYQESIRDMALENHINTNEGILMINAVNKSPKEIEKILDTRLYNRLFI